MERENYKVSILVAIYNIEKFIGKCIESLVNQDYTNIEIILVNDNSTDNSKKICESYLKKDSRIKLINHTVNTKLPGVRNTGLDNATGDYIVFVDGDDWLAPDFVSYMLGVITKNNSDMAINLVNFTTRDTKQVKEKPIEIWSAEKATAELLFPHLTIGAWNKIYKREFIEKNNLRFKTHLFTAEGDVFINTASQRANHVAVGYRKVYYYRLNNTGSATTKYDIRQSEGAISALKELEAELIIKTPYVLSAMNTHQWLNHFWNIRQIIALNLIKEKKENLDYSVKYVKNHAIEAAKSERKVSKKIKYILAGIFPISIAKLKNKSFDNKLNKDVKKYIKIEKDTLK